MRVMLRSSGRIEAVRAERVLIEVDEICADGQPARNSFDLLRGVERLGEFARGDADSPFSFAPRSGLFLATLTPEGFQ